MKKNVYFDYNIYGHILGYQDVIKDLENIKENYRFFYSGAIAEEVYNRKCNDKNNEHDNEIEENINLIKSITDEKCLRPNTYGKINGIMSCYEKFEVCYRRVKKIDTRNKIKENALEKLEIYNKLEKDLEWNSSQVCDKNEKEIWEFNGIKEVLSSINTPNFCMKYCGIEISRNLYSHIRNNYPLLEVIIELLFNSLELIGYNRDREKRKAISGIHDTSHIIYATFCDVFVCDDEKLRKKAKGIYYFLGINTEVLSLKEFVERING